MATSKLFRKRLKGFFIGTSLLILSWLITSYFFASFALQRRFPMYAEAVPDIAWGKIESFRLTTSDNQELGAWFIAGTDTTNKQPVVLLLHGHNGRRSQCLPQAEIFASAGCPQLLISHRAHGDSTGDINDIGYSARTDVLAAVDWLEKNHGDRPIVIYGLSMGAASALFASAQLGQRVQGYILECPFQDLRTAVRNRTRNYLPAVLDTIAYAGLLAVSPLVLPDLDRISPVNAVTGVPASIPVLVLAGSADRLALPAEARAICERISGQATLVVVDGAPHSQLLHTDPVGYRAALLEFIGKCAKNYSR